jgi:hypothetical protein
MDTVRIYHVPVEGLTKYYKLDVDQYNQPSGIVNEVYLKEEDFKKLKGHFIYKSYIEALRRAQN